MNDNYSFQVDVFHRGTSRQLHDEVTGKFSVVHVTEVARP